MRRSATDSLFYLRKTLAAHASIECIVLALQLFFFVKHPVFRQHIMWDNVFRNTLIFYLQRLTRHVEKSSSSSSRIVLVLCLTDGHGVGRTISVYLQHSPVIMIWDTRECCSQSLLWSMRSRRVAGNTSNSPPSSYSF